MKFTKDTPCLLIQTMLRIWKTHSLPLKSDNMFMQVKVLFRKSILKSGVFISKAPDFLFVRFLISIFCSKLFSYSNKVLIVFEHTN